MRAAGGQGLSLSHLCLDLIPDRSGKEGTAALRRREDSQGLEHRTQLHLRSHWPRGSPGAAGTALLWGREGARAELTEPRPPRPCCHAASVLTLGRGRAGDLFVAAAWPAPPRSLSPGARTPTRPRPPNPPALPTAWTAQTLRSLQPPRRALQECPRPAVRCWVRA